MDSLTIMNSTIPKKLEVINQEAKRLFPYYYIHEGKVLSFGEEIDEGINGIHFMELSDDLKIPALHNLERSGLGDSIITFSSISMYNALKDTKRKDIHAITVEYDKVTLDTVGGRIRIGNTIDAAYVINKPSYLPKLFNVINFKDNDKHGFSAKFKQKMIEDLMSKCITLEWSGYKIRMSKRLLPNLKSKDVVSVHIKDEIDGCFNAIFEVTKESGLKIYHAYDFINY